MRRWALLLLLTSLACASTRLVERPVTEADREQLKREMWGAPDVRWRDERGEERVAQQVMGFVLLPDSARFAERLSGEGFAGREVYAGREVPVEALCEVSYRTQRAILLGVVWPAARSAGSPAFSAAAGSGAACRAVGAASTPMRTPRYAPPAQSATPNSSSSQTWTAAAGSGSQGSYTLSLTDLGSSVALGSGLAYPGVHGTLDATLPAAASTGASGTVTLHAVF